MPSAQLTILNRACTISSQGEQFLPEHWWSRMPYLMISLKNPAFTGKLITWYVEMCQQYVEQGVICVVDEPYQYNLMADLDTDALTPEELNALRKFSYTKRMQVQRYINTAKCFNVQLIPWFSIAALTPRWIRDEIMAAFERRGQFYEIILQQVRAIRRVDDDRLTLERYARFLLCEIPVETYACYAPSEGVVDFYPGPRLALYGLVERGELADELPRTTAFVQASQPLIYVQVAEA